jgi:hypothetical protein
MDSVSLTLTRRIVQIGLQISNPTSDFFRTPKPDAAETSRLP